MINLHVKIINVLNFLIKILIINYITYKFKKRKVIFFWGIWDIGKTKIPGKGGWDFQDQHI